jgi:hypothetical protein
MYVFSFEGVIFDDVAVEGLATGPKGPLFLAACAFRHVTLRGKIGQLLFHHRRYFVSPTSGDEKVNSEFHTANLQFYKGVDWALDISEARFSCLDLRGAVPASLVRRDEEHQFVLARETAVSGEWGKVPELQGSSLGLVIEIFVETGMPDTILSADRGSSRFGRDLEILRQMKRANLVS